MIKECINCGCYFEDRQTAKFCKDCRPLIKYCLNKYKNYNQKYCQTHKWYLTYKTISNRCNNPLHPSYNYYGNKGIYNFLKTNDLKYLWIRDNANNMITPSLHRKDNNGNYTLENCEYKELSKHISDHKKN